MDTRHRHRADRRQHRVDVIIRPALLAGAGLVAAACSVTPSTAAPRSATTSTTAALEDTGIIQLRPVIPPEGAAMPSCPVGEALGTCTASVDFTSWERPASQCSNKSPTVNPAPDRQTHLLHVSSTGSACFSLAPASYVLSNAASVGNASGTLNGDPGIVVAVPRIDTPALDAALGKSFKEPLAIVANGQIVEIVDIEPTNAQYQPMGGVLVFYGTESLVREIARELLRSCRPNEAR